MEHLRQALDAERRALADDPDAHWRLFNVAVYLLAQGDHGAAERQVRDTLDRRPDHEDVHEALIDFADLHAALGIDIDRIAELLRLQLRPHSA
jgi:hypothetical protein